MAIDFSGNAAARVASGSAPGARTSVTQVAWLRPDAGGQTANTGVCGQIWDGTMESQIAVRNTDVINFAVNDGITELSARSTDTLTDSIWQFVAATAANGASTKIYVGSLTATVAEVAGYSTQDTAAGNIQTPTSVYYAGNRDGNTLNFDGDIGPVMQLDYAASLAQLIAIQYDLRAAWAFGNVQIWWELYGTGTQADLSGNGLNGTVTSAASDDHVPLRPLWGAAEGWQGQTAPAPAAGRIMSSLAAGGGLAGEGGIAGRSGGLAA